MNMKPQTYYIKTNTISKYREIIKVNNKTIYNRTIELDDQQIQFLINNGFLHNKDNSELFHNDTKTTIHYIKYVEVQL